ncbi:MAG: glycoside hydrolase family 32 protein, partial [Actinomycetota bacterium]|nr:glycoside hydrolase family 32 protein [Actinomycetota bacterium]
IQSQCLAASVDGIVFEKYKGNPVITEPPPDGSVDFRDPRVWKHNRKWYMVIGSCKDGKGVALLYCSDNLREWDYIGVLAESDGSLGYMWECPDFFPIGDKYILTFSPIGVSGRKTFYIVGDMDYKKAKFKWDNIGEVDYGFDYYITQTFLDRKGRRIIIGWINAWNWMPWWKGFGLPAAKNWCGAMSIPRIVELDNKGHLKFKPVEELKILRDFHIRLEDIEVKAGLRKLPEEVGGKSLEIIAEFELKSCKAVEFGFNLSCSEDGSEETVVLYNVKAGELHFARRRLDLGSEDVRTYKLGFNKGENLKLHIFIDIYFLEIFADNGRVCLTNNLYSEIRDINLFARDGRVKLVSLDLWKLKSIW